MPGSNMCAATRLCLRIRFRGGLFISHGWSTGGKKNDRLHGVVGAGCRSRHGRSRVVAMTEPKTVPEMLDAAETGEDFMSDLRTRIALTVDAHERVGASCKCGFSLGLPAIVEHWQEHLADAVIRKLGLQRDDEYELGSYTPSGRYRYVTDWTTDE